MGKSRAVLASYVGVLLHAAFVFIGAGKLRYWQGGLYVALALLGTTLAHALSPASAAVAERRLRHTGSGEAWDRRLLGAMFLTSLATFVLAGMDSGRYGWSGAMPLGVTVAGALLMLVGQLLFALARRENAFFSSTVRLQAELDHVVCQSGPYRYVRHPGYLGLLASQLGFPLLMNSWWAFAPTAVGVALLLARTTLEDRFLARELAGYADYATQARWRLLPGLY